MDYMNNEETKTSRPLRMIGKMIKWMFIAVVVLMLLWLTLCSILQKGTPAMKKYVWTAEAAEQYAENKEFKIWNLTAFNTSSLDKIFYIENLMYTEEPSQFQFMLRYNVHNESVKKLSANSAEKEPFVFVLKDNKGKTYTKYEYMTDSALIYGYYRVVFSGVDTSEATELTVYIYRNNGENTDFRSPVDSCIVWYNDGYKSKHKLTASEKKAAAKPSPLVSEFFEINDLNTETDTDSEENTDSVT